MTVVRISNNASTFLINTSDISGGTFVGALSCLGASVYDLDSQLWYKIDATGQLISSSQGSVITNGLTNTQLRASPVSVTSVLTAGTAVIGSISGNTIGIDVSPTLTVHATYVSGDYVGTSGVPMSFVNASRINNYTGTIVSAVLIDSASIQSISCELWLFDTLITPPADSTAWNLSSADMIRCIGIIPFSTYYVGTSKSISFATGIGIGFKTITSSSNIYGCLVTRGTPTYASGDLTVRLTIWQD